ncbi:MAG: hypothetical protein GXP08_13125 [Gammaproteobacteria bacterium]|nr:hypothetical protein [Gammaproteobacteria bacterium]
MTTMFESMGIDEMQNAIYINSTEIKSICEVVEKATKNIIGVYRQCNEKAYHPNVISPDHLMTALYKLLDVMAGYETEYDNRLSNSLIVKQQATATEPEHSTDVQSITEVGNHGLQLLEDLREWADLLGLAHEQYQIRACMVIIALWIARHGGELNSLESIVTTLSEIANSTDEYEMLVELSCLMGELIDAVALDVKFDFKNNDPASPWRLLNLNRGIIATRSHDINIMEYVFEELLHNIPEDAQMFFEQGMQQMEELDYPDHVRAVVSRYHKKHRQRVLH